MTEVGNSTSVVQAAGQRMWFSWEMLCGAAGKCCVWSSARGAVLDQPPAQLGPPGSSSIQSGCLANEPHRLLCSFSGVSSAIVQDLKGSGMAWVSGPGHWRREAAVCYLVQVWAVRLETVDLIADGHDSGERVGSQRSE